MRGVIAAGTEPSPKIIEQLMASPRMEGLDLASLAGVSVPYSEGTEGPHVGAWDFGMKRNIVTMLAESGCRVTVVPSRATAADILAFVSRTTMRYFMPIDLTP